MSTIQFPFVVSFCRVSHVQFKFQIQFTYTPEWVFNHHKWLIFLLVRFWIRYLVVVCCSFVCCCLVSLSPTFTIYLPEKFWLLFFNDFTSSSSSSHHHRHSKYYYSWALKKLFEKMEETTMMMEKEKLCLKTKYTKMGMINNDVWLFFRSFNIWVMMVR